MITFVNEEGRPINETAASETLQDSQKPKKGRDAEVAALEAFMRLDPAERTTLLKKALSDQDNDAWDSGEDYAERNRQSLKDAQKKKDMPTLRKEMAEAFPEFTPELQSKFAKRFSEAVAKQTLADAMAQIFAQNPELKLMFAEAEELDEVQALAERVQELEELIGWTQWDNEQLRKEAKEEETSRLYEDFIVSNQDAAKKPYQRKHNIADDWEPNPENIILMETDTQPRRNHHDPMSKRVAYLEETTLGRPIVPPSHSASYLVETWEKSEH